MVLGLVESSVQVAVKAQSRLVGTPIKRFEDPKFITGRAAFVDDIRPAGVLYARFVRSPYAHARIKSVDTQEALTLPGIKCVLKGADLTDKVGFMPTIDDEPDVKQTPRPVLAINEVNYVGEPVAAVVAEDLYSAFDAAEQIEVEYELLPPVKTPMQGWRAGPQESTSISPTTSLFKRTPKSGTSIKHSKWPIRSFR
jgi:carbon-monoxide dehydrogenase large subunit